jgi:hypothetical protein
MTLPCLPAMLFLTAAGLTPAPEATMDESTLFARSSNAFGFDLYRRLKPWPGAELEAKPRRR